VEIDIYSDVVCPWCYIGKRRFENAVARFDGDVTVRYRPFQLDPSTPSDGRPLLEWLAPKFGGEERVRQITAHTTSVAAEEGIELRFGDAIIANTFDAHRLIWFAGDEHGSTVSEALHRAHFTDGRDIASRSVLASIAAEAGLDESKVRAFLDSDAGVAEVRASIAEAHQLGITSVPTFVLAGKYAVTGAQDADLLLRTLEEVARREAVAP
jgi:predicted DsbA family dithiol-disulfide isomerase